MTTLDIYDLRAAGRVAVTPIEGGDCYTVDLTGLRPLANRAASHDAILTTMRASVAVRQDDTHVSADVSLWNPRTGVYRRVYETRPVRRHSRAASQVRDRAERWIIRHARETVTSARALIPAAPIATLVMENHA